MPAVSVIIPTFNRRKFVREAIDSVLAQDFDDFELIVVDDGSTDGTAEALADYGNRIRLIRQSNRGVSAARNTGIRASEAPLIALLDSDDLWRAGKLTAQTAFLRAHPDVLICQTEEIWVRNGLRVNPRRKHRKPSGDIFARSLELCLVSPSAVMMRRRLLDEVGLFDESLPACEDYDLWLRVACRHAVHRIDAPLIVKRGGHADQLSRRPGLDRYRIRSLARLLDLSENLLNSAEEMVRLSQDAYRSAADGNMADVKAVTDMLDQGRMALKNQFAAREQFLMT